LARTTSGNIGAREDSRSSSRPLPGSSSTSTPTPTPTPTSTSTSTSGVVTAGLYAESFSVVDGLLAVADGVLAVVDGLLAVADGLLSVHDGERVACSPRRSIGSIEFNFVGRGRASPAASALVLRVPQRRRDERSDHPDDQDADQDDRHHRPPPRPIERHVPDIRRLAA